MRTGPPLLLYCVNLIKLNFPGLGPDPLSPSSSMNEQGMLRNEIRMSLCLNHGKHTSGK